MKPESLLEGLGQAVRERRLAQGLSQEALSLETGIHRNYIGGIERAERQPTISVVARLGEAFGVAPSELIRRGEELAG